MRLAIPRWPRQRAVLPVPTHRWISGHAALTYRLTAAGRGGMIDVMEWTFEGPVIEWRGPAPFLFVSIPEEESAEIRDESRALVYWGQVPVIARIGDTEFTTALFPKDGRYLLPVKVAVQRAEEIGEGAQVSATLRIKGLGD